MAKFIELTEPNANGKERPFAVNADCIQRYYPAPGGTVVQLSSVSATKPNMDNRELIERLYDVIVVKESYKYLNEKLGTLRTPNTHH